MNEEKLGRRLQAARVHAKLTQQTLCQKAGLSYSTLTKIERGAIKSPSIFTIRSIADALGVGLDELMGLTPAQKRPTGRSKSGVSFVYFDINGCLVRFFHRAFTRIGMQTGAPADVIETAFWHYNDQVCRGDMTLDAFNHKLAETLQIDKPVDWQSYYMEAVEPIVATRDLVTWVSQHYKVGLLTNIMPGFVETMLQNGALPQLPYDAIVDSASVKAIKPESKIYSLATEKAGCPAKEILLVDDSRINLMAAEKHNWHVLWFDSYRPEESVKRIKSALELI